MINNIESTLFISTALIFCKLPALQTSSTNEVASNDEGSSNSEDEDVDEMIDTSSDR